MLGGFPGDLKTELGGINVNRRSSRVAGDMWQYLVQQCLELHEFVLFLR